MQDDGRHHIPRAHGGLEPGISIWQGNIGKLVEHEPDRDGQAPAMHLICLIVELLERLGIEHTYQKIEGDVVAVRDDAEDGLFPLPQLLQLHVVRGGDPLDLRQSEWSQTDRGGN